MDYSCCFREWNQVTVYMTISVIDAGWMGEGAQIQINKDFEGSETKELIGISGK